MLFNSIPFFIFFTVVFILYYGLPHKLRWVLLLASGAFFYIYSSPATIAVPVIITLFTYFCGIITAQNANNRIGKIAYASGLIVNLGLLIFYKYINFFIANSIQFIKALNGSTSSSDGNYHVLNLIIPLGISYITFQAIGYLVEIRKGNMKPEGNIGLFAAYVFFFPKLLSGPIERAHNFLPQLLTQKEFDYMQIVEGMKRVLWGLFKKLVIANRLAIYTDAVFNNAQQHNGVTLAAASLFYTFQLYADFSGYTDMAIGFAQMLGFRLSENFNLPFFAKSMTEFWRRWHISLTSWITDYIYNPLVFRLRYLEKYGVMLTSIITLTIIGFWHGASWTFILFGLFHGLMISVELLIRKYRKKISKKFPFGDSLLGMLFTFFFFTFTLIFFRADSIQNAFFVLAKISSFNGSLFYDSLSMMLVNYFCILCLIAVEMKIAFYNGSFSFFHNENWIIRNLSYAFILIMILLLGVFDSGQFIYFQF